MAFNYSNLKFLISRAWPCKAAGEEEKTLAIADDYINIFFIFPSRFAFVASLQRFPSFSHHRQLKKRYILVWKHFSPFFHSSRRIHREREGE